MLGKGFFCCYFLGLLYVFVRVVCFIAEVCDGCVGRERWTLLDAVCEQKPAADGPHGRMISEIGHNSCSISGTNQSPRRYWTGPCESTSGWRKNQSNLTHMRRACCRLPGGENSEGGHMLVILKRIFEDAV